VPANPRSKDYDGTEWNFRTDGRSCPLGYNPLTALVMPRPIGWISTYSKQGRVPHLAPYSFFSDVARGGAPVVGFSAYRRDGVHPKDAHKDAEEMQCFCFNLVSHDLAVSMNYSAAELPRDGSEFALAQLAARPAEHVDAPYVADACVVYECVYVKTVEVESFSIVLGAVQRVHVRRDVLRADGGGGIDATKLRPIARMGFMDEYGVLFE
jgi:flavin reductase (DIM6/NTAB) family NADH-FMN oxidoreductase RutF